MGVAKKEKGLFHSVVEANKSIDAGSIVVFYHGTEYLGKGLVIESIYGKAKIQLDNIALANLSHYSTRFFDFMMLDEDVEVVFDDEG